MPVEKMTAEKIRNVAIIAHVDHGKTTLVDQMLYQSGMFRSGELDKLAGGQHNLILDSDPLERERGITILSKNCAIEYKGRAGGIATDEEIFKINLIDTPGHADFGGEVERVLSMADGALLLVDSFEGPMPQTRFVLSKALENGLRPIVVVNKLDRPDARPDEVVNEVFDLLVELDADDAALDFPVVYASGRDGWSTFDPAEKGDDLRPILDTILERVPPPTVDTEGSVQLPVTSLDYSEYVGRIAIGRVKSGVLKKSTQVMVTKPGHAGSKQKINQLFVFQGLGRREVDRVEAGDLCAVVGLDPVYIGDTICDAEDPRPLPASTVDEPTLHLTFRINDGPFAGRDGEYVTSRQLRERLERELLSNVALQVEPGDTGEEFRVSGRGLMHLGILLENMRREGYELCAGMPRVINREINGKMHEPIERLAIECPAECQSAVIGLLGNRRAEMLKLDSKGGADYLHLEFTIPARGLIGIRERLLTATQGRAVMHHTFLEYQPLRGDIQKRTSGVMIATEPGQITSYALDGLYDRGTFFCEPGDQVYEGMVVGEHNKDNDIDVNVVRTKKLTNVRASGKDDASAVRPIRRLTLEAALEYIQEDELVEITPKTIRLRKRLLREGERRRAKRQAKGS